MAYVALLLAVLADVILQLHWPAGLGAFLPPPDLPLLTALYIGFHARNAGQLGLAIFLGLLADVFSSHALGHFAFLFGSAAYLARGIRRYLPPDAALSYSVAAFFCGTVTAFLGLALAVVTTRGSVGAGFARALLEAFASAVCAPPLFALWERSRLFGKALGGSWYEFA